MQNTTYEFQDFINNREAISEMLENTLSLRRKYWNQLLDERKNIDDECGYPKDGELTINHYRKLYDREPVPNRIVNIYPDESWVISPRLYEDEDPEISTQFEEDFDTLAKSLRGGSFFEADDEEGHPIWEYCHRIDRLSGIGTFGALLLGTNHDIAPGMESAPLASPIELGDGGKKTNELLYLRAFDESLCQIVERDLNESSPRYGMPMYYELSFEVVDQVSTTSAIPYGERTVIKKRVHWTRVIHVVDTLESSEVFGVPRIQPCFNRCYDIRKVSGGSGEMYWRGALPPIFMKSYPELGPNVKITQETKDSFEQLMNTLQRWAFAPGMEPVQLAPTVVDPSKQIDVALDSICIQLGCPKRVFLGSERGELASSQDAKSWNNRLRARQYRYLIPRLIVPLIDRLIHTGCLTRPKDTYKVSFADLNSLSEKDKAQVTQLRTQALVQYVQGGGDSVITEMDFLTKFLDFSDDEAEGMVERAMEQLQEQQDQLDQTTQPEGITPESQAAMDQLNNPENPTKKQQGAKDNGKTTQPQGA